MSDGNSLRQGRSLLIADAEVQDKVNYARQFAAQSVIGKDDLLCTTQTDLLEQESKAIAQGAVLEAIESLIAV